jgi:hypothetical protein
MFLKLSASTTYILLYEIIHVHIYGAPYIVHTCMYVYMYILVYIHVHDVYSV